MAIGCAVGLWLLGVVFSWIVSGPKGGSVAFVLMVMALPVMPILGMPAAGGTARLLVAISSSAVLWWILGQVVAGRVTKRPVVGWREWLREFSWWESDSGLVQQAVYYLVFWYLARFSYTVT